MTTTPTLASVRRMADRHDLRVEQPRSKDWTAGSGYRLSTADRIVLLGEGFDASLEEIHEFLVSATARLRAA